MFSPEISALLMIAVFGIGYFFITIEHSTKINKTAVALFMAIVCWVIQFTSGTASIGENVAYLSEHVADISQILFFILGALAIVELISVHKGFQIITDLICVGSKRSLLWVVCSIAFFLSAILDNLTTTIVMVTLLKKLIPKNEDRLIIGSGVVVAANAGGAWTPIGDVTTTMLWIGEQLSTFKMMKELFLPSLACLFVSTALLSRLLKGNFEMDQIEKQKEELEPRGQMIFFLGILALIFVPVFKISTGLPPFMGMLFSLSILWLITDLFHKHTETRDNLRVPHVLTKIDLSGVLFFLGILLAVSALQSAGLLDELGIYLDQTLPSLNWIAIVIGLASSIVDNVPLVAAAMSMYDLTKIPQDHEFWQLVAYTAGTGGSLLIIGSAAGVVYMGLEKVDFFWYLRKITFPAFCGFFSGVGIFLLQRVLFGF